MEMKYVQMMLTSIFMPKSVQSDDYKTLEMSKTDIFTVSNEIKVSNFKRTAK